jgi:acetoin utilization protein AcuB
MTAHPLAIEPEERIGAVVRLMRDKGFRHLPVVEQGRLVGIVSDRDLRQFSPPVDTALENLEFAAGLLDQSIREVAVKDVITVKPDDDVTVVIDVMLEHRIGAVCVTGLGRQLLGIVSYSDLLRVLRGLATSQSDE